MSLAVSESDDPILLGQVLFYNLTVTNLDPDAASGVVVTVSLPAGTNFTTSLSSSQCASGALPNTVTCTVGSVAGSASSSIIIAARVPETMVAGALIDFSASVAATQTDPALANNSTNAQTTIGANSVVYEDDFTDGSNGQWSGVGLSEK